MSTRDFSRCCVGMDGMEDLCWFSQGGQVTEDMAREKFPQHAALIPPDIGLWLYARHESLHKRRLLVEKAGVQNTSTIQVPHAEDVRRNSSPHLRLVSIVVHFLSVLPVRSPWALTPSGWSNKRRTSV